MKFNFSNFSGQKFTKNKVEKWYYRFLATQYCFMYGKIAAKIWGYRWITYPKIEFYHRCWAPNWRFFKTLLEIVMIQNRSISNSVQCLQKLMWISALFSREKHTNLLSFIFFSGKISQKVKFYFWKS